MKSSRMLACASALFLMSVAAQAEQAQPAAPVKFLPPVRGEATVGFTMSAPKRTGELLVTTVKVKNMSTTNNIVGLKVEDYWYDAKGNTVTLGEYRHRKPLTPGETVTLSLETPVKANMARNQYKFSHANGPVKPERMNDKGELLTATKK